MTIRNPLLWGTDQFRPASAAKPAVLPRDRVMPLSGLNVGRISMVDLRDVLARGWDDFGACRSDVLFLCAIYPVIGFVLAWAAAGDDLLPLLFPMASGFALIGPLVGVGLYEISRQREQRGPANWATPFGVFTSPSFGSILALGLLLTGIYILWLLAASAIYAVTLGPQMPGSLGGFVHDVFLTPAGWAMIAIGVTVGAAFALLVLAISAVSFPLLLDHQVGVETAIKTSFRAIALNPGPMVTWGLIVTAGLVLGSLPCFVGLVVVLPVLGHATWHLYRRLVSS